MPNLGERHLVNITNEIIKARKVVSLAAQLLAFAITDQDKETPGPEVFRLLEELREIE